MQGLGQSNLSHDFYAYNLAGGVWNGSAFVTFAVADYASYRIAATKLGDANSADVQAWFSGTEPSGTTRWEMRERAATLAESHVVWTGDDARDQAATAATQSTNAATEIGKVGRSATPIAAGAAVRWTKVAATSSVHDYIIEPKP